MEELAVISGFRPFPCSSVLPRHHRRMLLHLILHPPPSSPFPCRKTSRLCTKKGVRTMAAGNGDGPEGLSWESASRALGADQRGSCPVLGSDSRRRRGWMWGPRVSRWGGWWMVWVRWRGRDGRLSTLSGWTWFLGSLIGTNGSAGSLTQMPGSMTMVFTRTCESTRLLALILRNLGMKAIPISSQLSQAKRLGALNKFKAGECNILVCTGLMSRGLDIPQVDLVINYDIPENSKDYIHRVGRTARAGRTGLAVSLVNQYEVEWYLLIEKLIGKKLPEYPAEEEEVLQLLESVSDARMKSLKNMKDDRGNKRKRRGEGDEEADEHFIALKSGKRSNKSKWR